MKTAYFNGIVYTGELPFREAFVTKNGCFGLVGSDREVLDTLEPGDERVDLKGHFVCAGFNDSHMHLLSFGHTLYGVKLAGHTGSLTELLKALERRLREAPPRDGGWLKGRGWNQDYFSDVKRMPDRHDLDRVSGEIPILITRACGHCAVVNTRALALAGIDSNTPDPEGGTIGHSADGEPDGRLFENAIDLLNAAIPKPDREEIKQMLGLAMEQANRYGITSVQTDDYSTFRSVSWEEINEAYRSLEEAGQLTVRVTQQANFTKLSELRRFVEAGNVTGRGSSLFRIGPLKML